MLDEFVQVVYEKRTEEDCATKLAKSMEVLPVSELKKIAQYGLGLKEDGEEGWIGKYKGTPLFEQAVALEQQSLQSEMQRGQSEQQRQLQYRADDQARATEDQLRIQKRMLDLELASQENVAAAGEAAAMMGGGDEMGAPPEGAAPPDAVPPEVPPEALEAGPPPEEAMKMAALRMRFKLAASHQTALPEQAKLAEVAGRLMTHVDMEKEAINIGGLARSVGRVYKNRGFGAAASRVGNIAAAGGKKALNWAGQNPGTAVGIAGGVGLGAGAIGTAGVMSGRNR